MQGYLLWSVAWKLSWPTAREIGRAPGGAAALGSEAIEQRQFHIGQAELGEHEGIGELPPSSG